MKQAILLIAFALVMMTALSNAETFGCYKGKNNGFFNIISNKIIDLIQ